MWLEPRGVEGGADVGGHVGPQDELLGREVHGDAHLCGPAGRILAGPPQDPVADLDDQAAFLGGGDELGRGDHAADRVAQAHQGLAGDHRAGADVDYRLVVDLQIVLGDRLAQHALQLALVADGHVHFRREDAREAAAVGLGPVERHVGPADQVVGLDRAVGDQGDPDAGADRDGAVDHQVVLADGADQPLGGLQDIGAVGDVAQQHLELVAAEARDHVAGTHGLADAARDQAQQLVARRMAARVVDVLEVVEVDAEQRHPLRPTAPVAQRRAQLLMEVDPVGKAGDRVEVRHALDLERGPARVGHVLHHDHMSAVGARLETELVDLVAQRFAERAGDVALQLVAPDRDERLGDRAGHAGVRRDADGQVEDRQALGVMPEAEAGAHPLVHDRDLAAGVGHAQTVRHAVQGGAEALPLLDRGVAVHQSGDHHPVQEFGGRLHRDHDQEDHDRQAPVPVTRARGQDEGDRAAQADHLAVDDQRTGGVARRHRPGAADGDHHRIELVDVVGAGIEKEGGDETDGGHEGRRPEAVQHLPNRGRHLRPEPGAVAVAEEHGDPEHGEDRERGPALEEQPILGADEGDDRHDGGAGDAGQERADRAEEYVYELAMSLRRNTGRRPGSLGRQSRHRAGLRSFFSIRSSPIV